VTALQAILTTHIPRFRRCVWPVWESFLRIPEDLRLQFDATTEANVLRDLAVGNAKREFTNVPGVQIVDESTFYIGIDGSAYGIDGQAACRFKKMSADGHSRNYLTERALAIRNNEFSSLELEISDATIVDIGYVPDPLGDGFAKVQAVRLFDEAFILEIPREEGGVIPMPLPLHGPDSEIGPKKRFGISQEKKKTEKTPRRGK
jgi:hypothetical protein